MNKEKTLLERALGEWKHVDTQEYSEEQLELVTETSTVMNWISKVEAQPYC